MFNQGWPQQIGYSFVNHNWVMPARYFSRKMQHPDYLVEYFMIDSNSFDAKYPGEEPNHNICSFTHNPWGAQCYSNGGPSRASCRDWFWRSYHQQKKWLERKLAASTADWKIVVTHFPCGYDGAWYKSLKDKYGLDLMVTGHRHQQELWWNGTKSKYIQDFMKKNQLGDLTCFITGGGGGITHNDFTYADYGTDLQWYGFFDLTISKRELLIQLIGTDGQVHGQTRIYPQRKEAAPVHQEAQVIMGHASPAKASHAEAEKSLQEATQKTPKDKEVNNSHDAPNKSSDAAVPRPSHARREIAAAAASEVAVSSQADLLSADRDGNEGPPSPSPPALVMSHLG